MVYAHRPLEQDDVSPAAWKLVGPEAPSPLRGMVARGLAPLPPRDLVIALYQIWVTNDPDHATLAAKTTEALPKPILGGALDDPGLHPGALDFLARKLPNNAEALERIVRHRNTNDHTLASIARICPESVCDVLADNQERWLRFPAIVEELYQNPACRMSVIHRMLELAVRENVDVRLPNMEEIRLALLEGGAAEPERDEVFKAATGGGIAQAHARVVEKVKSSTADDELALDRAAEDTSSPDLKALLAQAANDDLSLDLLEDGAANAATDGPAAPGEERRTRRADLKPMEKIRLALLGDAFDRFELIRDSNKIVAMSAIKSPRVTDNEVVAYAANRTLARDVIQYIAKRKEWVGLYAVKLNLVLNPKTPLAQAMNFLTSLHAHDIKKVAFSKNIPSALAVAARRRMEQRR